jgi:ornithine cyclodeaminase/alanine dehydrogenase-like protein (mu-crystallin family)
MKIITESMVEAHLSLPACIDAMRDAMIGVSKGETTQPIRQFMPIPGAAGKMALMPGTTERPERCFGIKLVCKYERPNGSPLGTHVGMVLVFDSEQGIPLAMIEGASLTAIRTSAASALATDLLAKAETDTLAILGNGEQALRHVRAMLAVRGPRQIRVWGRNSDRAKGFAARLEQELDRSIYIAPSVQAAVSGADLICTTTASKTPILEGDWLDPGTHVNLVGAAIPTSAEADQAVVTRSRFFVDYRPAALAAAGELLDAIAGGAVTEAHIAGEIGEVAAGTCPGRQSESDITVYKSLGVSAQDLAAGYKLYEIACTKGFGLEVEMMDYEDLLS